MLISRTAGFVPLRLLSGVLGHPETAEARRFTGAALFADISGFSRITEELCARGADGPEQLASILGPAFRRYVDTVTGHGGEVVRFVGDGLVACWEDDGDDPRAATRAAVACAVALRASSRARAGLPGLHLGVDHGGLWSARLGGADGRWELLLGGDAVRGAGRAAQRAGYSVVVLGPGAAPDPAFAPYVRRRPDEPCWLLGDYVPSTRVAGSSDVPPRSSVDESYLHGFVPRIAKEQTTALDSNTGAELRLVTTLFVRLDGLDENTGDALERFQVATALLHRTVRGFSSSTGQLLFDDKGLVFLVVFGAPYNTHSDDCRRAARAALALQVRLGEIGLSCSIGIATGRAFCGTLGSERRHEYATVGPAMNTAARLMQRANGAVLVTSDVARRLDGELVVAPAETLSLRASEAPLSVSRILGSSSATSSEHPLVGRRLERERLRAALVALSLGTGGGLLLVGDAGLGKSRLLRHMEDAARPLRITCAVGAADAAGGAPYQALRAVFREVFGLTDGSRAVEIQEQVLARLRPWSDLAELAPLLSAVLPIGLPDTAVTRTLEGQQRADATLRLLVGCLDRIAPKPLLVLVEDAHWMDSASWRLLEAAVEHTHGILFVLATRPLGADAALHDEATRPWETLALQPLSVDDVTELVSGLLGGGPVAPEVSRAIFTQTAGNALFAQECTLSLRESGQIVRRGERWEPFLPGQLATDLARVSTVQGMVASRLDNLSAPERRALNVASIIGEHLTVPLLARLLAGSPPGALDDVLQNLRRRQILTTAGAGGELAFRHAVLRDVAYDLILFKERRVGHRRVAELLEADATSAEAAPARLAHHWSRSDDPARAVPHADVAAGRALGAGAHREAVDLLKTCLQLSGKADVGDDLAAIRWRRQLCDAYEGMGDNPRRDVEAARLLSLCLGPARLVRARVAAESLAVIGARMGVGARLVRGSVLSSDGRRRELELARARRHRAAVCYYQGDAVGMMVELLSAIAHGQRFGPCVELSTAMAQLGGGIGFLGFSAVAEALQLRAIDVAGRSGDPLAVGLAHLFRAVGAVGRGEWDRVAESARVCLDQFEQYADLVNWCNAQVVPFWAALYRGDERAAGALAHALLERAEQTANEQHRIWGLRCLGTHALERGDTTRAIEMLDEATRRLGDDAHANEVIAAWGPLALGWWRSDQPVQAAEGVERVLRAGEQIRRPSGHAVLVGLTAVLDVTFEPSFLARDDARRAALRQRGLQLLSGYRKVFPIGAPAWCYYSGRHLADGGHHRAAARAHRDGLAAVDRLGMEIHRSRLREALER